jgi:GNAT superfamily N-acetyltransferase
MNDRPKNQDGVKITIRLATESDAPLLARIRYAFRSSINPARETEEEFERRCGAWMRERLREGNRWRCWLAEQDRSPVGNLWVQLIEKIPNPTVEPERHAYVTNFYVNEGARDKGIGSMLLSVALDWCKAQDAHSVILWPTEQSRSLYLRHGFAVREDLLELLVVKDGECQ